MKITSRATPIYNADLNFTTIQVEFTIKPTFIERIRIFLGENPSFMYSTQQAGVSTISKELAYNEGEARL